MKHQRAGNLVRKDQARRLRYQELQRIKSNAVKAPTNNPLVTIQQSEGQLKVFASKLIK